MKKAVIAGAALLTLVFAVPAFAVDISQPQKGIAPSFDQMKADRMKKIDERMTSLQEEKACVQAAKTQDDLKACWVKHKDEMKEHRGDMKMKGGPGGPGGQMPMQMPPQGK